MQIKDLITETKKVEWMQLKDLQPHNLKVQYHGEKTKQSIIKNGFASAIYVWQEPETNDIYIADGHTRSQVLHELYNDGYNLPEKLPCTFIDNNIIKTKKQAIKILLEVFNLKTNPINKENLVEWLKVEEVKIEELHIEELELNHEEDNTQKQDAEQYTIPDSDNIMTYNEFALFGRHNKYDIPMLLKNKLFNTNENLSEVIYHNKQELDIDTTYLILDGGPVPLKELNTQNNIVGFFAEDYRFEKVWKEAIEMIDRYKTLKPKALLTPNFSLWADEPLPFQIMSWYKTQWCGRYWQEAGFNIIPTLNWSTEESFDFCFLGVPKYTPIVFIQIRNVANDIAIQNALKGLEIAYNIIEWGTCYIYGAGHTKKSIAFLEKIPQHYNCKPFLSWTDKKHQLKMM